MAQARIATGAPRYLLPGAALACVVAGVFVADVARALSRRLSDPRAAVALGLIAYLGLAALLARRLHDTGQRVHEGVQSQQRGARLAANLPHAIALAGGRDAILRCGDVNTQAFQVPLVAWQLRVPVGDVHITPLASGTVLQHFGAPRIPISFQPHYRYLGNVGDPRQPAEQWTALSTCTTAPPTGR